MKRKLNQVTFYLVNKLEESKIGLNVITDKKLRSEFSFLIENCLNMKIKTVDVKIKNNLTGEILICSALEDCQGVKIRLVEMVEN